jgi:ankyrin repeat protein
MEPAKWGTGISRLLIEKGAIIDTKDKYGMNALHMACIYDRVEFLNQRKIELVVNILLKLYQSSEV